MNTTPHNPEDKALAGASITWHVNQERARQLIDQSIANAAHSTAIPTSIARLIAATVHHGPATALGRFAATGELDRLRATEELEHTSPRDLPAAWRHALDRYLRKETDDGKA